MSKGTFKIIVKSANLTKMLGGPSTLEPFAQIIFGLQTRRTKVCEGGGLNPVWNECFTFKKKDEFRLSVQVFQADTGSRDDLVGMQEIGINTFMKKKSVVDHRVELMNDGAVVGEVLLNIEYTPEVGAAQSWQTTNQKQKVYGVHKLLITKLKANLEFENTTLPSPSNLENLTPILKITMGKKIWRTSHSNSPGKNLSWSESFNLVIETEKELCLEIIEGEQFTGEERLGSAIIKLKSIKTGSAPNKIPIILDGQSIGFLFFMTEYQVPLLTPSVGLEDSSIAGRLSSPYPQKNGKLIVTTLRVYLEKNNSVDDAYVLLLWGSSIEKTSIVKGETSKPEWKEILLFNNSAFENKLEVKLLDKNCKSEDDVVGYGYLLLDSSASQGGKQDIQGQKDINKNDPLDMKKKTKPTEEELRKKEMLQKRKEMMKASVMSIEKNKSFLPQLDDNSNIFRLRTPAQRSPQPKTAVKAVHSISLPKIGYDIQIREYNKLYKDSVFGLGMSNVHSAQSLRHSIPSFSLNKADRFPQKKYDGFDSFSYNAPSYFNVGKSDNYKYSKHKIFTYDNKYEVFHKSPAQKPGVSFGAGKRFEVKQDSSPGYYQGPQLLNYNE